MTGKSNITDNEVFISLDISSSPMTAPLCLTMHGVGGRRPGFGGKKNLAFLLTFFS